MEVTQATLHLETGLAKCFNKSQTQDSNSTARRAYDGGKETVQPGCVTNSTCLLREPLGLLISREPHESGTTLTNLGGPEGLTFLIRQLFSASVKMSTAPGLSTDTVNI